MWHVNAAEAAMRKVYMTMVAVGVSLVVAATVLMCALWLLRVNFKTEVPLEIEAFHLIFLIISVLMLLFGLKNQG